MYLVIIIIISFEEKINRSFLELRLDLNSPELELELELKCPELELELELKLLWVVELELELELKTTELELELNWKNGIDPNPDNRLTHRGRMTHICICNLTIIGSDNGLPPGWCQAIIWSNTGILLIGPLETNSSKYQSKCNHFYWRKCIDKCLSVKW